MILSLPQIKSIILDNPGKVRIQKAQEYSKKLRRHIYGDGLDKHIETIAGYEKPDLRNVRAKYTKSNKDLFARLGRPIDKIFTAKGGSVYYNLSEGQDKYARIISQDVRNGLSLRKWIENFWKPHFLDDPCGIVLMEILPTQEAIKARQEGRAFAYPTYKSITTIYDYLPKGNKLEYVFFKLTLEQKRAEMLDENLNIFRVIDDAFDYYILQTGQDISVMANSTYQNYFGQVPAIINSDFIDPINDNLYLSLYDEVIELADQFLLKGSIKATHDFLHGFPKYAEFAGDCRTCKGTGIINGEDCKDCNKTGKGTIAKVSDVLMLKMPETKEDAVVFPAQIGAYISPDKTYHEIATSDIQMLEDTMNVTLWGMQSRLKTNGPANQPETKTATQIVDEVKPQSDRLMPISEMAEARHKFLLDMIISVQVQPGYKGSSVNYGRRYMLEGPDVIWLKYSDARVKGSPQNVLDTLLNEYYEANFTSDPVGLALAKKLMYVEPFVHYTVSNLKALNPEKEDYTAKLYFSEWLSMQNEAILISLTTEDLRKSLYDYAGLKKIPEEQKLLTN